MNSQNIHLSRFQSHPFNFLFRGGTVKTEVEARAAITQIEGRAADLIYRNEPNPASPDARARVFMPFHQNGTFSIGERSNTVVSGIQRETALLPSTPYGLVRDIQDDETGSNPKTSSPLFIRGELADFEMWAQRVAFQDFNIIVHEGQMPRERELRSGLGQEIFRNIPLVVPEALRYTGSDGRICDLIPNQTYIDYVRRTIGLYLTGNPDRVFYTEKKYNDILRNISLTIVSDRLKLPADRNDVTLDTLKTLMLFSLLSGVIGLDMKCSHCAASEMTRDNAAFCSTLNPAQKIDAINEWLTRKVSEEPVYCPELFQWDKYVELVLKKPCTLIFFPDDLGESIFDMHRLYGEMRYNPDLKVIMIPRNGRFHNDLAFEDVDPLLDEPCFAGLRQLREQGRFMVHDKGPRTGALEGPKLSGAVVDTIIENGDVVFVKGSRSFELVATGMRLPTFGAQTVAREFSESITGLDARSGLPALNFFHAFPDFWGFRQRHERSDPLFPTGRCDWQVSMTSIESSRFCSSPAFNELVASSSREDAALEVMNKAIEEGVPPHMVTIKK